MAKPRPSAKAKPAARKPVKTTVSLMLGPAELELLDAHQAANPALESVSAVARDLFRIARAAIGSGE